MFRYSTGYFVNSLCLARLDQCSGGWEGGCWLSARLGGKTLSISATGRGDLAFLGTVARFAIPHVGLCIL